jgi:hypothetical protein
MTVHPRRTLALLFGAGLVSAALVLFGATPPAHSAPGAAAPGIVVSADQAIAAARPGASQFHTDVAWDGTVFLVVWEERPAGGGLTQIYAARVDAAGTVLDPGGILLTTRTPLSSHGSPAVAGGNGRFLVVWEEQPEGTYTDLGAALVTTSGKVLRRWGLSFTDNGQSEPDVTWNGQLFLATWQDEPDPGDQDIYGTRVTSGGLTLDGCSSDSCPNGDEPGVNIGIEVGTNQLVPAVAGLNGLWTVVWEDQNAATPNDIKGNVVPLNGLVFPEEGVGISSAVESQSHPAIATSGQQMLTVWTDQRRAGANSDLFFARIQPFEGSEPFPIPSTGRALSTAIGDQSEAAVGPRSSGWIVTWTDSRLGNNDIFAARVGPGAAVLDPTGVPVATGMADERASSVAGGSTNQLVTYQRTGPSGVARIFFRMLS